MMLAEVHVKWLMILMDHLSPDIFLAFTCEWKDKFCITCTYYKKTYIDETGRQQMNNKLFWELFFTITEILAKHSVGSKGFSEVA